MVLVPQSIIPRMAEKKHVKIDDYNARTDYDFPFAKYAQVIMDKDGNEGTVVDAEWIGTDAKATFYTVTYQIKSNADGSLRDMPLAELLALNRL
jgi:hypothetical protein